MKRILQLLAALCLLQAGHAAVPDAVNFQGRALTATGEAMGKDGAVNRMFTLRIWDDATSTDAANLIYSEQQVVSIVDGAFNVLIGTGTATNGTKFSYSESAKGPPTVKIGDAAVFGGASRYVGVTIDDGTTAVDNEILPRQQFVSVPFATSAKLAELTMVLDMPRPQSGEPRLRGSKLKATAKTNTATNTRTMRRISLITPGGNRFWLTDRAPRP